MGILRKHKIIALGVGALIIALWVIGCAGMEPYEPRNNREEGSQKGLFTGAAGEFVIFRTTIAPETGGDTGKDADETKDGEKQNSDNEKKAEEKTSHEQ